MRVLVGLLLLMAMIGHSSANYCLCKGGGSDDVYQKALDYACGNGADCTAIQDGGPCYQPDNVKSHCDYAVNSYFQKKNQATGTCDFSQVAAVSANPPSGVPSGCVYPTSSGGGGGSPTGAGGGAPGTTPTGGTTTPGSSTSPGGMTSPGGSTMPGGTPSVFPGTGLGPTGPGGFNDQSSAVTLFARATNLLLSSFSLTLLWWGH